MSGFLPSCLILNNIFSISLELSSKMVNLPNEIIHAIIAEYKAGPSPWALAPLSAINRNWQPVVESYIWRILSVRPAGPGAELELFISAFRAGSGRRKLLKRLEITFDGYFAGPFAVDQRTEKDQANEDAEEGNKEGAGGEEKEGEEKGEEKEGEETNGMTGETSAGASKVSSNDLNHVDCFDTGKTNAIEKYVIPASAGPWPGSEGQEHAHHIRFLAFQKEHARFFHEVKAIWDQLNEWGDDLCITKIDLHVKGHSLYKFLGPEFCEGGADYFEDSSSLWLADLPALPSLPSVRSLRVWETVNEEMELWPAVVTSKIAILRISYITASLFWDLESSADNTCMPTWPNLRVLDVATGFERPTGDYWFRSDEDYPDHHRYDPARYEDSDSEELTAEDTLYRLAGVIPHRYFLTRPEPKLFDQLALSIARAVARMPKLEYFDLEFNATHQRKSYRGIFDDKFEEYEGWAFYFRASNEARFASTYAKPYWFKHKPGIDLTEIGPMRTEWVFQCPYRQVQWEEPEEARLIWQERSSQIDFDMVTFDRDNILWERRRNGELILSSLEHQQ
ncbi:hypothetical protein N0V95_006697 [Ascochyta clinopodiicola]|nr:hypothetical protein N0V95_006697 [Ascochyta clinopodiicola]